MRILKIFTALLISIFLCAPVQEASSCSWYYDEDDISISPFDQTLINTPGLNPFFYSYHYYNGYSWEWGDDSINDFFDDHEVNLRDWLAHFGNQYERNDLEMLIYQTPQVGYENIKNYIRTKKNGPPTLTFYPLVNDWKNGKYAEEFQYLYFAKQTEPLVQATDYWEPQPRDTAAMEQMMQIAMDQADKTTDIFVRQRYVYQAMRLAHYSGNYKDCLSIYDRYQNVLENNSLISYWCLSLRAGAYWRLGQFAQSSYYNSIVFDKCPSRKLFAERDFWIDNENTWQQCLQLCKNDHEKVVLWALTGINQNNSAIPALYEILKMEPGSEYLELLLAREIEKAQRNYFPSRDADDFSDSEGNSMYSMNVESNDINEISIFIQQGLSTNKVRTPAYWLCAEAFIGLMNNELDITQKYAALANNVVGNNNQLKDQIRILQSIATVHAIKTIDAAAENVAMAAIDALPSEGGRSTDYYDSPSTTNDAYRLIMYDLYVLFKKSGQFSKAEICRSEYLDYYDIYQNPKQEVISQLYAYTQQKSESKLDEFLKKEFTASSDNLLEILGTLSMQQDNYQEAVKYFTMMKSEPETNYWNLPADPFVIHIWDCHDCDFTENPGTDDKLTLSQKIIAMEKQLADKSGDMAEIAFQLGNVYYNMTHFGNSWMAKDYYLCAGCDGDYRGYEGGDQEFYDCTRAAQYYQLALNNSKDKEFQAKCIFMLAKCEQNNYYMSDDYDYENANGKKSAYRTNFALLNKKYSNTEFFQQAIGECKYFDYYVSKNK